MVINLNRLLHQLSAFNDFEIRIMLQSLFLPNNRPTACGSFENQQGIKADSKSNYCGL